MTNEKEIAVAILGASIGLASVLVVFMGFLLAHAWTFPPELPDAARKRYMLAARWGLAPTAAAVLEALACYAWLLVGSACLFYIWTVGFVIVAVGFLAYAVIAVVMI
jgi:hypothetical protein